MIPLGFLARKLTGQYADVVWHGTVPTPPEGSAALVIAMHHGGIDYPTDISVGGSAAELLSLGTDVTSATARRVSMWWCADPGPSGVLAGFPGDSSSYWSQVLYCSGLAPGEVLHDYNGSNATVTPHAPSLTSEGVVVSAMSQRAGEEPPVANHEFFDSGSQYAAGTDTVIARWTAGTDLPTDWTSRRYHAQMTVALNPIPLGA